MLIASLTMCTVGIFCGLSFSYILITHATAPRSARTLAQARPPMSCIHLVIEKFHSKLVYVGLAQARPNYVCEAVVAVLQSK